MESIIGRSLREPTWRWAAALTVGVTIVATDFCLFARTRLEGGIYARVLVQQADADAYAGRAVLALVVVLTFLILVRGDWLAIGLRVRPLEGWRWWSLVGCQLALFVPLAAIPIGLIWRQVGWGWDNVAGAFVNNEWPLADCCVRFPVFEEMLYRLAVCVPIAARFGRGPAIAASGILFAVIHVIYGALNPVNVIAGFLLAWVFLRSGSIVVPILLHALGNLLFWLLLWAIGPGLRAPCDLTCPPVRRRRDT